VDVPNSQLSERIGLSGGETSPDDVLVKDVFERTGAYVMGKRMFEEGEVGWPEKIIPIPENECPSRTKVRGDLL
jgi:hypothetical protein